MTDTLKSCIDPYLDSFVQSYVEENYAPRTIKRYRHIARKLGRAMDAEGITPAEMTPDLADKLTLESDGTIRFRSLARRLVEHLIVIGVAQRGQPSEAQSALEVLLADYENYLIKQRGLSPRSINQALRVANQFLEHRFGSAMIELTCLRAQDVIGFVKHLLAGKSSYRDRTATTYLRTFFQYLFGRRLTATNLALCIPRVAKCANTRLPRHLSPAGIEAVLGSVRSHLRHGARDYAMLLLMARLGLRAHEVVAIQLDDVDWRAGELIVRGKGKLHDRLPLTAEVGEAVSRYLREERRQTNCRAVFVTHKAPYRAFKNGQVLNSVLKAALAETGQKPITPYVGSHLLRHSLATRLVNAGASLDEVGEVLRHRSRSSTMIYARLDLDGLRSLVQPWPVSGGEK